MFCSLLPSFQEVMDHALKYAHLHPSVLQKWEKKIRRAPLLPRLQFGFDRRYRDNVNVNLEDTVTVNSSGITVGPTQQTLGTDSNNDINFEVRAVWYLDQLLFSNQDLEISQEARALARERQELFEEVKKYYFRRQEALRFKNVLEKDLATAGLDALTGGWFSEQVEEK